METRIARLLRAGTRSMRVSVERALSLRADPTETHMKQVLDNMCTQYNAQSTETRMKRVLARNKRATLIRSAHITNT